MHLLSKGKGKTAASTTDQYHKSMLKILVSRESTRSRPQPHPIHPPLHLPPLPIRLKNRKVSPTNPRHDRPSLAKSWDTHLHVEKAELFSRDGGAEGITVPEGAFRRPEGKWGLGLGFERGN